MKIHYFQRYHAKENVATANTMLLLSRLYSYSPDKFFKFFKLLNSKYLSEIFNPELIFTLQEKSIDSIPDATITQESFKIVVETKMSDWFYEDQLMRHLNSFKNESCKIIITLAPELMAEDKKENFEKTLKEYNQKQNSPVIHINTTFETIANSIGEILDERDYEIQAILNDYWEYCYKDGLISVSDAWKYMRMQLAGVTFDFNIESNIYYDNAERSFREHNILGLYKNKSVRAIGKIIGIYAPNKNGRLTNGLAATIIDSIGDKNLGNPFIPYKNIENGNIYAIYSKTPLIYPKLSIKLNVKMLPNKSC